MGSQIDAARITKTACYNLVIVDFQLILGLIHIPSVSMGTCQQPQKCYLLIKRIL